MKKFFRNLKVKNKILSLYGFNLLFSVTLILAVSIVSGEELVKYFALSEGRLNNRILNILLSEQRNELSTSTSLVSKRNVPKVAITNGDYKTLIKEVLPKAKSDSVDIMIIFDKNGKIIADLNNNSRFGDEFSSLQKLVKSSIENNKQIESFEVINKKDLIKESTELYERVKLQRKPTDGSKKGFIDKDVEEDALANIVIAPITSIDNKKVIGAVLSASILQKNFDLVDKTKNKNEGTAVTIFKDDLRITTTVLNKKGQRAIGTLVSAKVVDKVLLGGKTYEGLAMVIGKPYWSVYEPLKNMDGKVIGILFTAISEDYVFSIVKNKFGLNLVTALLLIVMVTAPISIFIAKTITKPLEDLTTISKKLGENDFTVVIENKDSNDEIGSLYNTFKGFVGHLKTMIVAVKDSSLSVKTATIEMNAANEKTAQGSQQTADSTSLLAKGANEISKNIEQGSYVINNMNKLMQTVSEEAYNISKLGNETETNANIGAEQVKKAVNKIDSIKNVTGDISVNILELGKLSTEIEQIVDLIKNIAGQTNLLALNAAIEAARAGEHGKGFAVVADEVKKLAGQSANATEKITAMIKEIQDKTNIAVSTMDKATHEVEEGVYVINDAGHALENIISHVKAANNKIQGVTKEIDNITKNSGEIAHMIENISAITEETASSAEEISSITEEQTASLEEISVGSQSLAKIAAILNHQVAVFKV